MNFRIVDGDDYYSKYEEFVKLYNNHEISIETIKKELGITSNKLSNYRKRARAEGVKQRSNGNRCIR